MAGRLWEVASDKGALVRAAQEVSSQELGRLSCGALVRGLQAVGGRLHYEKLSGSGPDRGWVSLKFRDRELLTVATSARDFWASPAKRTSKVTKPSPGIASAGQAGATAAGNDPAAATASAQQREPTVALKSQTIGSSKEEAKEPNADAKTSSKRDSAAEEEPTVVPSGSSAEEAKEPTPDVKAFSIGIAAEEDGGDQAPVNVSGAEGKLSMLGCSADEDAKEPKETATVQNTSSAEEEAKDQAVQRLLQRQGVRKPPFWAQGCNAAVSGVLPQPPQQLSIGSVDLEQWEAMLDTALTAALKLLVPDTVAETKAALLNVSPHEVEDHAAESWMGAVSLKLGKDSWALSGSAQPSPALPSLLSQCVKTGVLSAKGKGPCVVEYNCRDARLSYGLALTGLELGVAVPTAILLGQLCTQQSQNSLVGLQASVGTLLTLPVDLQDFDLPLLFQRTGPGAAKAAKDGDGTSSGAEANDVSDVPRVVPQPPPEFGPKSLQVVEIVVSRLSGEQFTVIAEVSLTVLDLKVKIAGQTGTPADQQRLLTGIDEPKDTDILRSLSSSAQPCSSSNADGRLDFTLVARSAERARWLERVGKYGHALEDAPRHIAADEEIVLAAIAQDGHALRYAAPELRADKEVSLAAVKKSGLVLGVLSEQLRADKEVVLAAVSQDGHALKHASQELCGNFEVVKAAVSKKGEALEHACAELKANRDIVLAAVWSDAHALLHAPVELRADREIIHRAVQRDACFGLKYGAPHLQRDKEIVATAVLTNPFALQCVLEEYRADKDLVLSAVRRNGAALQYAAEALRDDPDVVLAAVQNSGMALQHAGDSARANSEIVQAAVQQDSCALKHASEGLREDRGLALAAVQKNSFAVNGIAGRLRNDRDLILATVQKNAFALEHATKELLADRSFLLAAVQKNAMALEFVPRRFRNDRDFMLAVVQKNGFALKFGTETVRGDGDVVRAAIAQDSRAIEYANRERLFASEPHRWRMVTNKFAAMQEESTKPREDTKERPDRSAKCPKGHELQRTTALHAGFLCDACDGPIREGLELWSCRPCGFDTCGPCHKRSSEESAAKAAKAREESSTPSETKEKKQEPEKERPEESKPAAVPEQLAEERNESETEKQDGKPDAAKPPPEEERKGESEKGKQDDMLDAAKERPAEEERKGPSDQLKQEGKPADSSKQSRAEEDKETESGSRKKSDVNPDSTLQRPAEDKGAHKDQETEHQTAALVRSWRTVAELRSSGAWPPESVLICGQDLAGGELDTALRSLARVRPEARQQGSEAKHPVICAVLEPSDHHLCDWASYVNKPLLQDLLPSAAEVFPTLAAVASWATPAPSKPHPGTEATSKHLQIGLAARALLQVGRALWLRESGWARVELVSTGKRLLLSAAQ